MELMKEWHYMRPLGNFVLLIPTTPDSKGLDVLVPKGGSLLSGDTASIPLNYKFHLLSGHFGPSGPGYQRQGITIRLITISG